MTQTTQKWVRRVYYTLITLALITVAVLLMIQCVAIYRLGGSPFTRASVAAHFAPIAAPIYVCLGIVAVGFALSPLLPAAPDSTPDRDVVTLRRLQGKTDLAACPAELTRSVCKLRRARSLHYYITLVLLAIGTAAFLWFAADKTCYTGDKSTMVIQMTLWMLICMGVPAAYGIFTAYFCRSSVKAEIALLRTAPKEAISPAKKIAPKSERWMPYLQGVIVAAGIGMIVYGALEGGAGVMLAKAIAICTECIGLG